MSRVTDLLDEKTIKAAIAKEAPAKLKDGGSLYLWLRGGSALWLYHYREGQAMRTRSLGSYPELSPNAARKARNVFAATRDRKPIERRGLRVINSAAPAHDPKPAPDKLIGKKFADVVELFLAVNAPQWKASNRDAEMRKYRHLQTGSLGDLSANDITATHVASELQTRWGHALASADKYRMRILKVMSYAAAAKYRADNLPNPADKDILRHLIASAPKSTPHKAMPSADVPAFYAELVADGSPEARALAFAILTNTRTTEARDVDWSEIRGNVWTIPAARTKEPDNGDHRIPLTSAALALLGKPKKSGLVFGKLPHDALIEKLSALRPGDGFTVHGFRTAFRGDWALKQGYPLELREMALGHTVSEASTQSYKLPPAELYTVRIPMTQKWSDFVTGH